MAKKDYKSISTQIVEAVGGKDNISFVTHCMTRLRLNVRDRSVVNKDQVEKINGVVGCAWSGEQFQIIIGQDVSDLYTIFCKETGLQEKEAINENLDANVKKKISFGTLLDAIAGCLTPLIPVLTCVGMLKVVLILLEMAGILTSDMPTYTMISFVSDAGLYFMPVYVGANAAKKFGANMGMGMMVGAMLISPTFISAVSNGTALSFVKIPVYLTTYSSTIFPVILSVYVMSYIEKFVAKHSPSAVRSILEPLVTILIMIPLAFCILGPIGSFLGTYLADAILWLYDRLGFLALAIFTSLLPLLIMTGMHNAFTPYALTCFATLGYEPIVLTANFISNMDQAVACLAVAIKSKNQETRSLALSCAISAFFGITEPAMFGITIRYKKPLYGAMIGSFCGAAYAGITHILAYVLGSTSIFGFTLYVSEDPMNLINCIIAVAIGTIITFIATFILYKEQVKEEK